MLATSSDILNLVLAGSAIVLTFFVCWAIYYLVASVHLIYRLSKRIEKGVTKVEEVVDIARDKLKNSSTYFMILGEIAKKALDFVQDSKSKTTKKSRTKRK